MSEAPPDFSSLARRYLDLWQEQVAAMANEPALAEALARGIAAMTEGANAFVHAASAGAAPASEVQVPDAPSASARTPNVPRIIRARGRARCRCICWPMPRP